MRGGPLVTMTNGQSPDGKEQSATREEIKEWDEENDDPHPVFDVPHRPERISGDDFIESKDTDDDE